MRRGEKKETSKGGRLSNQIRDEPEKEFERLRIAAEEEKILFSTPSQSEDIQVTTKSDQESLSEGEQVTTTTTTTEEEISTTAALTTPATTTTTTTTTTTEPETPRSVLPNQNVVPSTHVRFPQEETESEGRHSNSVVFGPQLPDSHHDSQLALGPKDSRPSQAKPLQQEKETLQLLPKDQQGPELPQGTISFQPRHPDPILQVVHVECFVIPFATEMMQMKLFLAKVTRVHVCIFHHLMLQVLN